MQTGRQDVRKRSAITAEALTQHRRKQAAEAVSKQRDANLREQRLKAELAAASSLLPSSSAPGQLPDLSAHGTDALRRGMEETMTALTGWMHSPAETWAPKLQHLALILATGEYTPTQTALQHGVVSMLGAMLQHAPHLPHMVNRCVAWALERLATNDLASAMALEPIVPTLLLHFRMPLRAASEAVASRPGSGPSEASMQAVDATTSCCTDAGRISLHEAEQLISVVGALAGRAALGLRQKLVDAGAVHVAAPLILQAAEVVLDPQRSCTLGSDTPAACLCTAALWALGNLLRSCSSSAAMQLLSRYPQLLPCTMQLLGCGHPACMREAAWLLCSMLQCAGEVSAAGDSTAPSKPSTAGTSGHAGMDGLPSILTWVGQSFGSMDQTPRASGQQHSDTTAAQHGDCSDTTGVKNHGPLQGQGSGTGQSLLEMMVLQAGLISCLLGHLMAHVRTLVLPEDAIMGSTGHDRQGAWSQDAAMETTPWCCSAACAVPLLRACRAVADSPFVPLLIAELTANRPIPPAAFVHPAASTVPISAMRPFGCPPTNKPPHHAYQATVGPSAAGQAPAVVCSPEYALPLSALLACMDGRVSHRGVVHEAAWLTGSMSCAGVPGRALLLQHAGAATPTASTAAGGGTGTSAPDGFKPDCCATALLGLLGRCALNTKKETALALANLAEGVHGGGEPSILHALFTASVPSASSRACDPYGFLSAALGLCRATDPSAMLLGLRIVSLVLRAVKGGPRLVEELDGIDALESVEARGLQLEASCDADAGLLGELCEWAHALVDQYYGEDYDPDADED